MKKSSFLTFLKKLFLLYLLINNLYSIDISILIKKEITSENNNFHYSFEKVKTVSDAHDAHTAYHVPKDIEKLIFTFYNGDWYLNNKKLKIKKICLHSKKTEKIVYENLCYEGIIELQHHEGKIYVTNTLDLENYVAAVVAKEFYSVWHFDSLKIAAIIIRTYALHKFFKKKENAIYHIKNSISDQHYCGYIYNKKIKDAVEETKGKIITWQKKPIMAMYHVCCGGVIPQQCIGFNFEQHPYLKRKKQCIGCKNYKRYEWEISQSHDIFCDYLSKFLNKRIVRVKKVLKIAHANSGTVRQLLLEIETLKNRKQAASIQISLTNKQLRKILNLQLSAHSAFFKLHFDKEHNIKIIGRGNGHHMGLCQIGMNEYIKDGLKVEEIIKFYYPETQISHFEEISY